MNVRKVPVPKAKAQLRDAILTKGNQATAGEVRNEFNTEIKAFCHECQRELHSTNPEVRSLIDAILASPSFWNKKAPPKEEVDPECCEHGLYLDQGGVAGGERPVSKDIAQCVKCELKSNIWMCLQCGHLGCGHSNHIRSGGISHAAEHFE